MPVVQNVARDPAGNPARATVTIRLIAGDVGSINTPAYGADGTVIGVHRLHTGDDGYWSVDLEPNDAYLPVGTFYEIAERPAGTRVTYLHYTEVPDVEGPVDLVGILVDPVAEPDSLYLLVTQKGAPGGLATLDEDGQVPADQLGNASGGGGGDGTPSSTVTSSTSFGQSASAGAATAYSRGDHVHGTPAAPTPASIGAATSGHTHTGTYDPAGTATSAVGAHVGASDPHGDRAAASGALSAHVEGADPHGDRTYADSAVSTHNADTTSVHGIADTATLVLDDDARLSDARTPTVHAASHGSAGGDAITVAQSQVTGLSTALSDLSDALDLKAPLASPALTGNPTAPTQTQGNNSTRLATTAYVQTEAGLLVPKSLVDAKGDLLVGTAADTVGRLAVGTDGYVLTADSTQTAGVKWAAAPTASGGGGSGGTDFKVASYPKTGLWYRAPSFGPVGSNLTMVQNRLCLVPFRLGATTTFDRIGCDVATVGAAGCVLRLGIFQSDASGGLPGTLVLDAGTVAAETGTGSKTITISQALNAGVYWLGVVMQGASGALLRAVVSYDPLIPFYSGASAVTGAEAPGGIIANGVTGALASNPTISENDRGPMLSLRAA